MAVDGVRSRDYHSPRLIRLKPAHPPTGLKFAQIAEERGHDEPVLRMTVGSELTITVGPLHDEVTIALPCEPDIAMAAACVGTLDQHLNNAGNPNSSCGCHRRFRASRRYETGAIMTRPPEACGLSPTRSACELRQSKPSSERKTYVG